MTDRHDWMDHLHHLPDVAQSDLEVLAAKESTYQGSWKRAGGRSAWFMFRRNMDRLISMMAPPKSPEGELFSLGDMQDLVRQAALLGEEEITLSAPVAAYLYQCWEAEDLFRKIEGASSGADGTVLACLRDLRRYAMLVEAEMLAQGVVEPEAAGDGGEAAQALASSDHGWSFMRADYDGIEAATVYGEMSDSVGRNAVPAERSLGLTALSSLLRALQPDWSDEIIERSAHHAAAVCAGADIYTQVASLTGEDRQVVKTRAYEVIYGGPLAKPQDADLGKRIARAIKHAVNYHGLDSRLDTPDHVIAELITPEVVRHLENRTDAQLVKAGWTPGPSGEPVLPGYKPGTPEDGGHHHKFTNDVVVGRRWSLDFGRMRHDVLAYITDPVSDRVHLTMKLHHTQEDITVRLFLRGGQLSFETVGSGIQASGEANELVLGRLFREWCVDDLPPEPRSGRTPTPTPEKIQEHLGQTPSLDDILQEIDKAREAAGDPPGLHDGDPMTNTYEEKGK